MKKLKLLTATALIAGMFAFTAPAEARTVPKYPKSTMQMEYGFQKNMKGNKRVKDRIKPFRKDRAKANKKVAKKFRGKRYGTTPNECIKPPCGLNYDLNR